MQIDWWTLALQAINFIVLVWLLHRFLYKPVRAVIEKRKHFAEQAFDEAEQQKKAATVAEQRLKADRDALAEERRTLLGKLHEEMQAERDKTLANAQRDASRMVDEARKAIAEERRRAVRDMRQEMAQLAVDLAGTLLQKTGAPSLNDTALERICAQVEGLPAEERARMADDLARDGARLTVVTAAPVVAKSRKRWQARLAGLLGGDGARIDFESDPGLLGGAELRLPHTVVKFTWADLLDKAKTELSRDETVA